MCPSSDLWRDSDILCLYLGIYYFLFRLILMKKNIKKRLAITNICISASFSNALLLNKAGMWIFVIDTFFLKNYSFAEQVVLTNADILHQISVSFTLCRLAICFIVVNTLCKIQHLFKLAYIYPTTGVAGGGGQAGQLSPATSNRRPLRSMQI